MWLALSAARVCSKRLGVDHFESGFVHFGGLQTVDVSAPNRRFA
jgi:hypothetical protein